MMERPSEEALAEHGLFEDLRTPEYLLNKAKSLILDAICKGMNVETLKEAQPITSALLAITEMAAKGAGSIALAVTDRMIEKMER